MAVDNRPDFDSTTFVWDSPFQLVAYLLFRVRLSLEVPDNATRPLRWVRIAKGGQLPNPSVIIDGVKAVTNAFGESITYMQELVLDIREMLNEIDSAKAVAELAADLLRAATDTNFQQGIQQITGTAPNAAIFNTLNNAINTASNVLQLIPDPDDLDRLGYEIYRLLAIEQKTIPLAAPTDHLNVDLCGKLRLINWSYKEDLTQYGLGDKANPESKEVKVLRFGARRLKEGATQSNATQIDGAAYGVAGINLMELNFDASEPDATLRAKDIEELHALLEAMGYPAVAAKAQFGADTTARLREFQFLNDLPVTGLLDNITLNQLLNMDYLNRNLRRARPYDAARLPKPVDQDGFFKLVNPDADHFMDEGSVLQQIGGGYVYYEVGAADATKVPAGGGWVRDGSGVAGFVGMESRKVLYNANHEPYHDYTRGRTCSHPWLSEGTADQGKYFFSAREVEPWLAARCGVPAANALHGGTRPNPGEVSRMYQWIILGEAGLPNGVTLTAKATVRVRALYKEWDAGHPGDACRISLEAYKGAITKQTPRDSSTVLAQANSPWQPDPDAGLPPDNFTLAFRASNWHTLAAPPLTIPADATALCVVLEGKSGSGYDIDAYFDNVRVMWSAR